jgi:chromosome partitioning protein
MYIYSVTNQKGGVGKTATTAGIGAALTELGYRVLLVDLDPQGHLTTGATGVPEAEKSVTLAKALLGEDVPLNQLVTPWRPNLDVIPTNQDSFLVEQALTPMRGREYQLERVLAGLSDDYDFCLIDAPPSLGILTDNALVAARRVLIPVEALDSSIAALDLLIKQIRSIELGLRESNVSIEVVGMIISRYNPREGDVVTSSKAALERLPVPLLGVVHNRAVIREAWRTHTPITEYAPTSGSAETFRQIAKHVARNAA